METQSYPIENKDIYRMWGVMFVVSVGIVVYILKKK